MGWRLGVWLVSDYTSTPLIFLPVLFLVMAFASYKPATNSAGTDAYFLLGPTWSSPPMGLPPPDQAWQIGLDRAEEIVVGILSSLLVTT